MVNHSNRPTIYVTCKICIVVLETTYPIDEEPLGKSLARPNGVRRSPANRSHYVDLDREVLLSQPVDDLDDEQVSLISRYGRAGGSSVYGDGQFPVVPWRRELVLLYSPVASCRVLRPQRHGLQYQNAKQPRK